MKTKKMQIKLQFPEGFKDEILKQIDDELKIASKKWGVVLRPADRASITEHALGQVRRKASDSAGTDWKIDEPLTVLVTSPKAGTVTLPQTEETSSKLSLISSREGWGIDREGRDDAVHISDFYEHFQQRIFTWVRTAVLYGVGSFVQ